MKLKDILSAGIKKGISADPRGEKGIKRLLEDRKKEYNKLEGIRKEIFDLDRLENPYEDSRIIWDNGEEVDQMWVGIDIDTPELLLIKQLSSEQGTKPVALSHHPLARSYSNFYEVMDMQSDIHIKLGVSSSITEALTSARKGEVARKVSAANHSKEESAARLLAIPTMNLHTPADNNVTKFLQDKVEEEQPVKMSDLIDLLLSVPEYYQSAKYGQPPYILTGRKSNSCGKVFVDMTGGTEGSPKLLKSLVDSGVSTIVGMHMSEKHYNAAKDANINVVIAGHISSDNIGMNIVLDNIISELGEIDIVEFGGFLRVSRDGKF